MSSAAHELLAAGIAQLGLDADVGKIEQLLRFIRLIQKWNKAYNLTAVVDFDEMVRLHLLDSLAIIPHLKQGRIIDIGTGAGLPGIPLAIYQPENEYVLLDSNAKKTRFVQQAIVELSLKNVQVVHARVEQYQSVQRFDVVITRAFASMMDIQRLTAHLLAEEGEILAMKGQPSAQELQQIKGAYQVFPVQIPGAAVERCVVKYAHA